MVEVNPRKNQDLNQKRNTKEERNKQEIKSYYKPGIK